MIAKRKESLAQERMLSSARFMASWVVWGASFLSLAAGMLAHALWLAALGETEPLGYVSKSEWFFFLLYTLAYLAFCLYFLRYRSGSLKWEKFRVLPVMLLLVLYVFYCGAGWMSAKEFDYPGAGKSFLMECRAAALGCSAAAGVYAVWKWLRVL
ncbi:hypothetical protein [Paenibacillus lutrae]|uniref:Uncharacterized protein n=1 Tax=Paenibacillus lutrae TaxID=2078573 RepID=A0A7X3FMK2_9BACL|nr:hypothetical protein [Paenibacillus lutrae]MVP02501.1 hypothetical protein [Paenibacillus lutrae]